MSYMRDINGVRLDTISVATDALVGSSKGKDYRRIGPVTTDVTSATQTNTFDAALNNTYALGNNAVVPSTFPVDPGVGTPKVSTQANGYWELEYPVLGGRVMSMMTDAPKIGWRFAYVSTNYAYQIFVDGAPVTLDPVIGNGQQYLMLTFPNDDKPRLVEIMTRGAIGTVYCANPYRVWKPAPKPAPKIVVIGDSYTMSTNFNSSGVSQASEFGVFHRMRGDLGVVNMGVDGIGGSGFINRNAGGIGAPNNNFADRLPDALDLEPDMLVFWGGGNDLANGYTNQQIIDAATDILTDARTALPNCKLVFVEGASPPGFAGGFNAAYIAIRAALQTALVDIGVYYIDVATTNRWIFGTGYYGNLTGDGNSDLYIGPDAIHLMQAGCDYMRGRMAERLRAVLTDNGELVNELI